MPTRKNFRERRHKRHDEAEKRAAARLARTEEAQLALIKKRPGASWKEIARISVKAHDEA